MAADDRTVLIRGGRVMLPDGCMEDTDVVISGGRVAALGKQAGTVDLVLEASGLLVLPGIVDLHGDAFERQIMPRAGVSFPLDLALLDTDRQMLANGITTAFHGVTWSWEPGLRSRRVVVDMLDAMETGRTAFGCDTRFHLRFETYNLEGLDEAVEWLDAGRIDLLAFNDHMPSVTRKIASGKSLARHIERTGLDHAGYVALVENLVDRESEVPAAIARLASAARNGSVAMASHDDETALARKAYHELGCRIAEFPLSVEASEESNRLGDFIVLGAPNVVRGGSHLGAGGIDAVSEIVAGRGDILCSDYYYPALMQAPFRLAGRSVLELGQAWRMVSAVPARAAGLHDRGEISPGKRADLVVLKEPGPGPAMAAGVLVEGRIVYRSSLLA